MISFEKEISSDTFSIIFKITNGKYNFNFIIKDISLSLLNPSNSNTNSQYHVIKKLLSKHLTDSSYYAKFLYTPDESVKSVKIPTLYDELDDIFNIDQYEQ